MNYIEDLLTDELVESRSKLWPDYSGNPIEMRHGFSMRLLPNDEYSRKRFIYRIAEPISFYNLSQYIKNSNDWIAFDIGANVGYHALYYGTKINFWKTISIEPDPRTFKLLSENTSALKKSKVFNLGVGPNDSYLNFFINLNHSGDSRTVKPNQDEIENFKNIKISAITLENLITQETIQNTSKNIFIKFDIQGAESEVLNNSLEFILMNQPLIQTEYWLGTGEHEKLDLILERLCQSAYKMKALSDKEFQEITISDLKYFNGDILLIPKKY